MKRLLPSIVILWMTSIHLAFAINSYIPSSVENGKVVYHIDKDINLQGKTIRLEPGSILRLEKKGMLSNGSLIGNNTTIEAPIRKVFHDVSFSGAFTIDCIYPQWFGAKGDGENDDTKAVQAAIDMQNQIKLSLSNKKSGSGAYTASITPVFFPEGKYNIGKIDIYTYVNIKGNNAIIISHQKEDFVFGPVRRTDKSHAGWQGCISGLIFNVTKAISLNTRDGAGSPINLDKGLMEISNCQFKACDTPIEADVQSSLLLVHNCLFDRFKAINITACDGFKFYNNWLHPMQDCLKDNESFLRLSTFGADIYDNMFVPSSQNGANNCAWIELNGEGNKRIDMHHNRFSGEKGSLTAFNNKCEKSIVSLCHNQVYSVAGDNTSCAVRLYSLPLKLNISDNNGLIHTRYVVYVMNGDEMLFSGYENTHYTIRDNQFDLHQHGGIVNKFRFLFTREDNNLLELNCDDLKLFTKKENKRLVLEIPIQLIASPASTPNQEGVWFNNVWECLSIIGLDGTAYRQLEGFKVYTQVSNVGGSMKLMIDRTQNEYPTVSNRNFGIEAVKMSTSKGDTKQFKYGDNRSMTYPVKSLKFYMGDEKAELVYFSIKKMINSYHLYESKY